ncbi:NAD(P)-binding protein [Hortaea werneckii]|nr:NAD(P)-binding protein [Hortaea werneckii]KAI7078002.1 NAD(P)-binding protein [Hortaea werneckii]KAI7226238.1 NAD(P)-binding protein [Hortaea werneckii]KAI7305268.1 NAD(P)-binding protein [Hortaea werneckii]KAI7388310.1 NAD(P)-binding protein [Hortaea werneckii]
MASKRVEQIAAHLNFPKGMLAGQVAIITGSGQGIGAEVARLFSNEGAKVVVSDIDASKAKKVADDINASGGEALEVPGDMLDDNYLGELVKKTAEFGKGKIHIIVNNAGFTWDGVIHKTTDKQWDTILALHCTAPFKLVRAAAPYFRVKDGEPRSIVNISSTSGVHGNAGQANYALAKAGVTGLTKTIAKEWGPSFGVRANTIAFGHIATRLTAAKEEGAFITTPDGEKVALGIPQAQKQAREAGNAAFKDIPLGRPGTATEAASSVLAVCSPLFSYVSGQTISVTGGRNISRQLQLRTGLLAKVSNFVGNCDLYGGETFDKIENAGRCLMPHTQISPMGPAANSRRAALVSSKITTRGWHWPVTRASEESARSSSPESAILVDEVPDGFWLKYPQHPRRSNRMRPAFRREHTDIGFISTKATASESLEATGPSEAKALLMETEEEGRAEEGTHAEDTRRPKNADRALAAAFPRNVWKLATILLAIATFTQAALLVFIAYHDREENRTGFPGAPKPYRKTTRSYTYALRASENGTLYPVIDPSSPSYVGPPSPQIDRAWNELIEPRYFKLTRSEVAHLTSNDQNLPAPEPLPQWPGAVPEPGVYGGIDMLHSLHCVDSLRKALAPDYYAADEMFLLPGETTWLHLSHCIEQLRQAVLCHEDTTPVTLKPVVTELGDGKRLLTMLGETERKHTCRDSEEIIRLVKQRAAERGFV